MKRMLEISLILVIYKNACIKSGGKSNYVVGKVMVNMLPLPMVLSTLTVPP